MFQTATLLTLKIVMYQSDMQRKSIYFILQIMRLNLPRLENLPVEVAKHHNRTGKISKTRFCILSAQECCLDADENTNDGYEIYL